MTPPAHNARPLAAYPMWRGFEGLESPLCDLPRARARAVFGEFMADREERVAIVRRAIEHHGGFEPSPDERGVAEIDDWIWAWLADVIRREQVEPEAMSGFLHDVGVLVGEALIAERGDTDWQMLAKGGRTLHGYHLPVVAPFPNGYDPYWAVPLETVSDGYRLGNTVLKPEVGPFKSRLLFRYRLFVGREPWPMPGGF